VGTIDVEQHIGAVVGRGIGAVGIGVLAMAGDIAGSSRMADDLSKRFPENTALNYNLLPAIRAATALQSGDIGKAVTLLAISTPYELGQTTQEVTFVLYPVYLRGETCLAETGRGSSRRDSENSRPSGSHPERSDRRTRSFGTRPGIRPRARLDKGEA
jgi:hypothetical protein